MSTDHPVVARYMTQFEAALQKYKLAEWREIASDVRSHIAEAQGYDKPLDDIIAALGSADTLARAYAVELTMNPPQTRTHWLLRALKVCGIVAASGFLTFIVVSFLGTIAVGFTGSGLVMIALLAIEAAGFHIEGVQLNGIHPLLAMIAMGVPITLLGIGAGWLLWKYLRYTARMLKRALPRAAQA